MKLRQNVSWMTVTLLALGIVLLTGCGGSGEVSDDGATSTATLPEGLFMDQAPQGAQPIQALKASAKEGDEVVVHVIVGGTIDPIVQGRASAAIIDAAIKNDCLSEDDHCQTPWDYCCTAQEDKTANLATLQVLDTQGKVLAGDLSPRIKPLTRLTIRGVVGPRPDAQVLTIHATGIYIESAVQ